MTAPIRVTRTVRPVGGGLCPHWPEGVALALQQLAARWAEGPARLRAHLLAYTTPAVTDVGGASVCIEIEGGGAKGPYIADGGYVLALRPEGTAAFLPAIAGVPGSQGLDRYGRSRVGLAECLVMARPLEGGLVTFLHEEVLRAWLVEGCSLDVVLLARVTDFFLGLNAGTWLRFRISEVAMRGQGWVEEQQERGALQGLPRAPEQSSEGKEDAAGELLLGTGLVAVADVEAPPPDASELWQFWGGGGNSGVSGQVTLPVEAPGPAAAAAKQDVQPETTDLKQGEKFHFRCGEVQVSVDQWHSDKRGGDVDLTGDLVWPTGMIFCRYLCEHAELLRGRRVLDVGAGTGLIGLVAASLGATVTLVDVPRVMPLLAGNVAAVAGPTPSSGHVGGAAAVARPLWWGDAAAAEQLRAERGPFDVVLCCEVVYQQTPRVLEALRQTLDVVLARPGGRVVFAYQHRDGGELTDAEFFHNLRSLSGMALVSEESMDAWDDSWSESFRFVRTFSVAVSESTGS